MDTDYPLVSVIITCFNHGRYLPEALQSVYLQEYPNIEIIVVDDGSTDNTRYIINDNPQVKYVYQENQGLSSARNTGIKKSKGEFLVFLDADDWLLAGAVSINFGYLKRNKTLAFVSGAYENVFVESGKVEDAIQEINSEHYLHLLRINYIGMHATVMYRRRVFNDFLFDCNLNACEDYDIYLKIARKHPIQHHTKKIAAYRQHNHNMSNDYRLMLTTVFSVLDKQKEELLTDAERKAFKSGKIFWKEYYYSKIYRESTSQNSINKKTLFNVLNKYYKLLYLRYYTLTPALIMNVKLFIKSNSPSFILRLIHKIGLHESFSPPLGRIKKGDFSRALPFSTDFGYRRGGPVDRYYIENFLEKQSGSIKGRVLEVADNDYTLRFGSTNVLKSDILHIDKQNPKATLVGDLSNAHHLPSNNFDCIILTQTLHLIYDFKDALKTCYRMLKPGGTLLITVPGISHIDHNDWEKYWFWSFTDKSIRKLLSEIFTEENVVVESYGNVLVATAFLYGIGLPEMKKEQMDFNDSHYQVIVAAVAVKPE